jgi:nitrate reductase NapE
MTFLPSGRNFMIELGGFMSQHTQSEKSTELKIFIFLTVFLAPILAVLFVSALGFSIWFSQILMGPPGAG